MEPAASGGWMQDLPYEIRKDYACKICGNVPDAAGILEHGRGCYTQLADGGGISYVDLPHRMPHGTFKEFAEAYDRLRQVKEGEDSRNVYHGMDASGELITLHPYHQQAWVLSRISDDQETVADFCVPSFQDRVNPWMLACFGAAISGDIVERNHRFLEESLELVQSHGCTASEAHQLVDYVFSRPVGEKTQETGGVMVTLAALCLAAGIDMQQCAEEELERIWGCVEKIRAKQAAKPKHSPLPQ